MSQSVAGMRRSSQEFRWFDFYTCRDILALFNIMYIMRSGRNIALADEARISCRADQWPEQH